MKNNVINTIKSVEKINATKKWFPSFSDHKIDKCIACQIKKKKTEITNARNENCDITRDSADFERINRKYYE